MSVNKVIHKIRVIGKEKIKYISREQRKEMAKQPMYLIRRE